MIQAHVAPVGNLSKQISSAFIANQPWSFDGDFSTMGLQPNIFYNFESLPGAYFGYNGMISADWKADSEDRWTIPLGFVVVKMFSLGGGYGIEVGVGPYWNVVKPDGGQITFIALAPDLLSAGRIE